MKVLDNQAKVTKKSILSLLRVSSSKQFLTTQKCTISSLW